MIDGPTGDGMVMDSFSLRLIGRTNNVWLLEGQQMLNLMWTTESVASDSAEPMYTMHGASNYMLCKKVPVPKKPYLRKGEARIRFYADSSLTFFAAIGTKNNPLPNPFDVSRLNSNNYASAAGTDAWDTLEINDFDLDPGPSEEITIVAWNEGFGAVETSTGTYGEPLHASGDTGTPFQFDGFVYGLVSGNSRPVGIYESGATWNTALGLQDSHAIIFTESDGTTIGTPHVITSIDLGSERMFFSPHVATGDEQAILSQGLTNKGYAFVIELPYTNIASAAVAAKEITVGGF